LDSDVQSETFARLNVVLLSVKFFPGLKSSRRPVDPNLFKTVSSANVTWLLDHLVRSRQNARRNRQADLLSGFEILVQDQLAAKCFHVGF